MKIDPRTASTAALAYLGDAVIELLVRERLVEAGYTSSITCQLSIWGNS